MKLKWIGLLFTITISTTLNTFAEPLLASNTYTDHNRGIVSFDVSMPIDATGYALRGKHLKGGGIEFTDHGTMLSPLIAHETGYFQLPVVSTAKANKPLIQTTIMYNAIKLIDPIGLGNFFIKIGVASRKQIVSGVDQFALKDGTYTWQVPIFSAGRENGAIHHHTHNIQFMQVGSTGGPSTQNDIYTKDFYLYTHGNNKSALVGHPIDSSRSKEILKSPYKTHYTCHVHGIWGSRADPYRKIKGQCKGSSMTFPAAPNMDYEYGTFILPTVYSPWSGPQSEHCIVNGKRKSGCVNVKIASNIHYMAQKIQVRINKHVSIYAEAGTLYRRMQPHNLRYQCRGNTYLKNILPKKDCLTKSYLHGGWPAPYFSVGYVYKNNKGVRYDARYIYIPEKENANRLAWRDASDTQIYAISVSGNTQTENSKALVRKYLNKGLSVIKRHPLIYNILGQHFFLPILKKNHLYGKFPSTKKS